MNQEKKKQTLLGCLFLMPLLAVSAVFIFHPLFYTIYLSFFERNMVKPAKKFVGLANYATIFKDPSSWKITGNTTIYIPVLPVLNFVLLYILSFILSAMTKRGQGFYRTVFSLPSVIPLVVGSILYIWILNPTSGPVVLVLKYFGLALPFWSKAKGWVVTVLNITTSWKVFDYNFIVILAGVSGVSQEVVRATRLDSIPLWKILHDTVVLMNSTTRIYVFVTTIVQGFQCVFISIKVVTQGGPNYTSSNLVYMPYHEVFTLYRTDTSSTVSVITMMSFIALLLLESRFMEKGICYED